LKSNFISPLELYNDRKSKFYYQRIALEYLWYWINWSSNQIASVLTLLGWSFFIGWNIDKIIEWTRFIKSCIEFSVTNQKFANERQYFQSNRNGEWSRNFEGWIQGIKRALNAIENAIMNSEMYQCILKKWLRNGNWEGTKWLGTKY